MDEKKTNREQRTTFLVPDILLEEAKKRVESHGFGSLSEYIRAALREKLDREPEVAVYGRA